MHIELETVGAGDHAVTLARVRLAGTEVTLTLGELIDLQDAVASALRAWEVY